MTPSWFRQYGNQRCLFRIVKKGFSYESCIFSGVFPKRQGGGIPVCDCSKSFAQHQTPRTDSLYAQVSIELPCAHALWFLLQTDHQSNHINYNLVVIDQ